MAKYLDSNGLSHLIGKIKTALAGKSDTGHTHADLVGNVSYDSTSKKIQQTKGSTTTDVVTLATVATSGSYSDLSSKPTIPSAGTGSSYPAMDGTRALGSDDGYARVDHVHPTDTSRAPTSHASSSDTYGKGTSSNYGHVKLSDSVASSSAASDGVAATPKAVKTVADDLTSAQREWMFSLGYSGFDGIKYNAADGGIIEIDEEYYTIRNIVHYGGSPSSASSSTKVAIVKGFELMTGAWVAVNFANVNTAAVSGLKLQIDPSSSTSGTAKSIKWRGANLPEPQYLSGIKLFVYDGTNWELVGDLDTDTKNTAGSTDSSSKLFLVGATSQAANPQTYSHDTAYVGTDGHLYSDSKQVVNLSGTQALTNKTYNGLGLTEETTGFTVSGGTTSKTLSVPESYTLGAACAKSVDSSISSGSSSTNLPTSAAVASFVAGQIAGAATFQGTLVQTDSGSSATKWTQAELEAASYKKGWYWVCETASTPGTASTYYAGNCLEVGDMLFCVSDKSSSYAAADFTAIQNNIETLTTTEIDTIWAAV